MEKQRTRYGYMLMAPSVILMATFILVPVIKTIVQSFQDIKIQTLTQGHQFVGLENYINMLSDQYFISTFIWTLELTIYSVSIQTILAISLALLMKKKFVLQGLVRVTILLPWAIPAVIAGMIWTNMFDVNGLINTVLIQLGLISEQINFFGLPATSKFAIIVADVWKSTPYMSLLVLAGLMGIPEEYYEAAQIDGAGKIRQFWHVTLPLLKSTLAVTLMFRLISAMRSYGLVVSMTGGGPGGKTETAAMYAVNTFFRFGKSSYGSALSVVMMIVSLLISLMFINALMRKAEI